MIDLGTVKPGSTIRIPWSSFDKDDGSSITATNYAAADILIYKDGSTTERASTAGFTATTDFDSKTGKHLAVIDLADNTTAGFYSAGSEYMVAIDAVTVDAVTTGGWIARFRIGIPDAILSTTIATLSSQTSFTLTDGPAEDDALNGCTVYIHDVASAVQGGFAVVLDYTGSTKTVTLTAGTTFTAAATDNIGFFPPVNVRWVGATAQTANDIGDDANTILTRIGTPSDLGGGATLSANLADIESQTDDIGAAGAGLTSIPNSAGVTTLLTRVGTPSDLGGGASLAANLADIEAQTDDIGAAGAGLTAIPNSAGVGTLLTRVGTPSDLGGGASLAANLADIEAQTDDIGTAGAGLTAVPWNAAWDAEVQSKVQDALVANHLDHLFATAADGTEAANDSYMSRLVSKSATAAFSDYVNTTDSLQALRDRGDAAWITATGFSTHSAADVWAVATRVLTAGTNLNNLSAADVLTQVNAAIDTAIAELGVAAPTATPTLRTGLMLLYMALRNKSTTTATEQTISNNAGTTIAKAALSDDGTTFERAELASG